MESQSAIVRERQCTGSVQAVHRQCKRRGVDVPPADASDDEGILEAPGIRLAIRRMSEENPR